MWHSRLWSRLPPPPAAAAARRLCFEQLPALFPEPRHALECSLPNPCIAWPPLCAAGPGPRAPAMDGLHKTSLQRISASVAEHQGEEASELERAALERVHAKRLEAKEVTLVQDAQGRWQVVKLQKLNAASRSLLLSRVYRGSDDENLGFFARIRERLDK